MAVDVENFFKEKNLADCIAEQQLLFQEQIPNFDNRPMSLGNILCNIAGQNNYDIRKLTQFVLKQLSVNSADSFALRNIFCPLYGIFPNNGSQTEYLLDIVITAPVTLYAENTLGTNISIAEVTDDNDIHYRISKTQTFTQPGTYKVLFKAVDFGAITSPLNSITNILNPVNGWESVNNPEEPVITGEDAETDADLRKRLATTSPIYNSNNIIQGLKKKLLNIGCKDIKVFISTEYNNLVDKNIPIGSMYVVCSGGAKSDIFQILFDNTLGRDLVGTEEAVETYDGFSYIVRFDYSVPQIFFTKFIIHLNRSAISDELTSLKEDIVQSFNDQYDGYLLEMLNVNNINSIISVSLNKIYNALTDRVYVDNVYLGYTAEEINKKQLRPALLNQTFLLKAENIVIETVIDDE